MIILREKKYSFAADGSEFSMSSVAQDAKNRGISITQAYKERKAGQASINTAANNVRQEARTLNKAQHEQFASMAKAGNTQGIQNLKAANQTKGAYNAGAKSVTGVGGLKQWGTNTWNGLSKNQQLGMKVAGGAAAIGLTALAAKKLKDKVSNKDKE